MVKELSRIKDESTLACNDSVKIKTKEYIRNYMQKFGPVYKPSWRLLLDCKILFIYFILILNCIDRKAPLFHV